MSAHNFVVDAEILMRALGSLRRAKFAARGVTTVIDIVEAINELEAALQPENTVDLVFTYQGQTGKDLEMEFDGFNHGVKVYVGQ